MPDLPPYVEAKEYVRARATVHGQRHDVIVLGWRGDRVYVTWRSDMGRHPRVGAGADVERAR